MFEYCANDFTATEPLIGAQLWTCACGAKTEPIIGVYTSTRDASWKFQMTFEAIFLLGLSQITGFVCYLRDYEEEPLKSV